MSEIALCYVRRPVADKSSSHVSPAQRQALVLTEAERRGWTPELFEDSKGTRFGRTQRRPGWDQLKSRLDDPQVKAVIIENLSQVSRDIRDLANFVREIESRNIVLISLGEQLDTTTAMGRAFVGVLAMGS